MRPSRTLGGSRKLGEGAEATVVRIGAIHEILPLFVDKQDWSKVVGEITTELDYDNFKSEVARFQGNAGRRYEHALHDVWSILARLQGD